MTDDHRPMRPSFLVELLADPDAEAGSVHTVKIMHGDQLRAELEAGKNMVDITSQPFALTSLWVWAAMVRLHLTELPWQQWKPLVAWIEKVKDPEGDGLDPTRAALTPSP